MAHSPLRELGVALVRAPGVGEEALLRHFAQQADVPDVQRRVDGELAVEAAEAVLLGADRTLCQALKFSMCIHEGQLVVYVHCCPEAFSFSAAASTSFQVLGALFGSSPAFLKASLFT